MKDIKSEQNLFLFFLVVFFSIVFLNISFHGDIQQEKCLNKVHSYTSHSGNPYSFLFIFCYFLFYIFPYLFILYLIFR